MGRLWPATWRGGCVTRVDLATERTRSFPVGRAPAGLLVVGRGCGWG